MPRSARVEFAFLPLSCANTAEPHNQPDITGLRVAESLPLTHKLAPTGSLNSCLCTYPGVRGDKK